MEILLLIFAILFMIVIFWLGIFIGMVKVIRWISKTILSFFSPSR